jgi:hypothetical protein
MRKALLVVLALLTALGSTQAKTPIADDPYAALKLYDGKWEITITTGDREVTHIENHCGGTGLFFVCEQKVNGKAESLVVFLPVSSTGPASEKYKTNFLRSDASPAGSWNDLTIDSDRWVYSWENDDGKTKVYWRNINKFSDANHIHFEIQRSDDGATWKTVKGGDEVRVQ